MKKYILIIVVFVLVAFSCEDPYNTRVNESDTDYVTNDPKYPPTELDTWLMDNFTGPYNIEVKYRWDASEGDIYRTLVPPKVSQIQPVMDVVKDAWIVPFLETAGSTFIKTYCPKQFLLIGSARYNLDGTFTLGTAEGGRKVMLYVVNNFDKDSREGLEQMLHIVQHEFAHILNQKVPYPASFRDVTPGGYAGDWYLSSVATARANGFITNYAMASPEEDFAEMVSIMLVLGKDRYEAIMECEVNPAARAIIREKEQFVVQYYKEAFNINFYELQTKVQEALNAIAPVDDTPPEALPPVADVWGHDKENTSIRFDLTMTSQPSEFAARFNQDNAKLHDAGLALDYNFKLTFTWPEELNLRLYYYDQTAEPRVYQEANFYYYVEKFEDGTFSLWMNGGDENGVYIANELGAGALSYFFANRNFTADWLRACSGDVFVGLFVTDSPEIYCYGRLEN